MTTTAERPRNRRVACGHNELDRACPTCRIAERNPDYKTAWWPDLYPPVPAPAPRVPCRHFGGETGETLACGKCPGSVRLKTFSCSVHGKCTPTKRVDGAACCEGCREYAAVVPAPLRTVELNPHLLRGQVFNPSVALHNGILWLAYRIGWSRSRLAVCPLDPETLLPCGPSSVLALGHLPEDAAQEDPRLFVHGDRLHVGYTGYAPGPRGWYTSQCVARLDDGGAVEHSWSPVYPRRQGWEKNWGCFSHDGELYAVHTITPHRVLRLTDGRAEVVAETPWSPGWPYGAMRGGAAPVRVGDEYWSFFHGREDHGHASRAVYSGGVYAFEARPPFRPTRLGTRPLLYPVAGERAKPHTPAVVYPGSATRLGSSWLVAYGYHDYFARLAEFDAADVRGLLP